MRLLIVTQAVDLDDPVLGFFHRWIEEFATRFERIHVICLFEGRHRLPGNVFVHSLGKDKGASRIEYVWNFYKFIWTLRSEYEKVFVHMNQEYVLLGGKSWRFLRKPVYLWRNHYAGSLLTDLAAILCTNVFCTSRFSYTAKYKKTRLMPIGIDTEAFAPGNVERKDSILSLGRIAPSKRLDLLIEAIALLKKEGIEIHADVYGDALARDAAYFQSLQNTVRERGLSELIRFRPGVPNYETPRVYSSYSIFVNASGSGMYDKTIFEAAACAALPLAASRDWAELTDQRLFFKESDARDLAEKIETLLKLPSQEKNSLREKVRSITEAHSLKVLAAELVRVMQVR